MGLIAAFSILADSNPVVAGCSLETGSAIYHTRVRVVTKKIQSVEGLERADFQITNDAQKVELCGFVRTRQPVSWGFVVDYSGSMGFGKPGLAIARSTIEQVFETASPQEEFFLINAADQASLATGFTRDQRLLLEWVPAAAKGKTALNDAIRLALETMRQARFTNKAILLISDGGDNASKNTAGHLDRALAQEGVPLFIVAPVTRPGVETVSSQLAERAEMWRVATRSGGFAAGAATQDETISLVATLSTLIRSPYMLYFNQPANAEFSKLKIEVPGMRPKPLVLYRGTMRYTKAGAQP